MTFVTHLESALDGTHLDAGSLQTTHADRPLLVRYDLGAVRGAVRRSDLDGRAWDMWRYRELLPLDDGTEVVSLGEHVTPLLRCPRLGARLGIAELWVKDESTLPTGSFKARGMAMAVTMAKRFGVQRVAVPTAGNAGGALAAYAARAGLRCDVFMPKDTPIVNQIEVAHYGARAWLVDGLIHHCGAIVRQGRERVGWFDMSTLREPYRIEGKKTMGLELAEQMHWALPDVVLYPTGGGTGLIGMWKAFAELDELGWLETPTKPRMFACQSAGCAPLPRAFDAGARFADEVDGAHTVASGLRVPKALGDFMVLDAVRASGGRAVAAEEARLCEWAHLASSLEGIALCPEAAACIDVLARGLTRGFVSPSDRVVLFNTGAAQKYVEALAVELPSLDRDALDWDTLAR
ncbi:MAG: threonine synthase [Planctomycetota bacterium]